MKKILILLAISFHAIVSLSQERHLTIAEGLQNLNKKKSEIEIVLVRKNFELKENLDGILIYENTTAQGVFQISAHFGKNNRLQSLLWTEHLIFANNIAAEVKATQFEKDPEFNIFGTDILINENKQLRLLITPWPRTNEVALHLQIIETPLKTTPKNQNKPKAVFKGSAPMSDTIKSKPVTKPTH